MPPGVLLLLVACGHPEEGPHFGHAGSDASARCPAGMVEVQGGARTLGETDEARLESYGDNVIPVDDYAIASFCMDAYPFPGRKGAAWPLDGLNYDEVGQLAEMLTDFGRRPCTVTELLYAAAGKANWRYPTDPTDPPEGLCDPNDGDPDPIGAWTDCQSPMGVHDFQVRSTWGRLDEAMADVVKDQREFGLPEDHEWAAWGGTSRSDTYYSPDNYGIHFHASGDEPYLDDTFRVCADRSPRGEEPDPDLDEAWSDLLDAFEAQGTSAALLGG